MSPGVLSDSSGSQRVQDSHESRPSTLGPIVCGCPQIQKTKPGADESFESTGPPKRPHRQVQGTCLMVSRLSMVSSVGAMDRIAGCGPRGGAGAVNPTTSGIVRKGHA